MADSIITDGIRVEGTKGHTSAWRWCELMVLVTVTALQLPSTRKSRQTLGSNFHYGRKAINVMDILWDKFEGDTVFISWRR